MEIRKKILMREATLADGNWKTCNAITRIVAIGVLQNPFAGRFVEDLSSLFDIGCELGEQLMGDAVNNLAELPVGQHCRGFLVLLSNVT